MVMNYRWVIAAVCIGVVGAAAWWGLKAVPFHTNIVAKTVDLLAGFFVITVFVERALAVLNNIWFGKERAEKESAARIVQEKVIAVRSDVKRAQDARETAIKRPIPATEAAAATQATAKITENITGEIKELRESSEKLTENLETAVKELSDVEDRQRQLRLQLGFLFAVLISAAGARALAAILNFDAASLSSGQIAMFHGADILLTAGLIAGGSNGINAISELLGAYVDASRKRAGTP